MTEEVLTTQPDPALYFHELITITRKTYLTFYSIFT